MKQIIDIISPEEEEVEEAEEQFPIVLAVAKPQQTKIPIKKRVKPFKNKLKICFTIPRIALKLPLIIGVVILFLGGVFLYLTLQAKAMVVIKPILEPIKIEDEIQVSSNQAQIDFEKKIIPGKIIEKQVEKQETFKSTGKAVEQFGAQGSIFVYNNISPAMPLNLKQGTRFISSKDGKIYKAKDKISLLKATMANGKQTPSVTEVQVIAEKEGEEYNIGTAKFSIPGLVGTALYYNIWGESREKIEGGSQKQVDRITQNDIDNAEENLIRALKETAVVGLTEQTLSGFSFNKEAIDFNEPEFSCSQAVGDNLIEFNCNAKLTAKTLIFKDSDIQDIALGLIDKKLSSTKKLYDKSLITSLISKNSLTENKNLIFNLKIDAKLYNDIDQAVLIADMAGKSKEDIRILLNNNYPQIEKIDTEFWPFWIKRVPKNLEKVKISLTF